MLPMIVFEGLDGSGKDTQITRVRNRLAKEGQNVMIVKYPKPGDTDIQRFLSGSAKPNPETLMRLFLDEMERDIPSLRPMRETHILLVNRYYMSTIAYQGVFLGVERVRDEVLSRLEDNRLFYPDLTVYFDGDPVILLKRLSDKDVYERIDLQNKVRGNYTILFGDKRLSREWCRVNAEEDEEQVFLQVMSRVEGVLNLQK